MELECLLSYISPEPPPTYKIHNVFLECSLKPHTGPLLSIALPAEVVDKDPVFETLKILDVDECQGSRCGRPIPT